MEAAAEGQPEEQKENPNRIGGHFHTFIINKDKQLLELDGGKNGPQIIAENQSDVLRGTIAEIMRRISVGDITENVNMMVLTKD